MKYYVVELKATEKKAFPVQLLKGFYAGISEEGNNYILKNFVFEKEIYSKEDVDKIIDTFDLSELEKALNIYLKTISNFKIDISQKEILKDIIDIFEGDKNNDVVLFNWINDKQKKEIEKINIENSKNRDNKDIKLIKAVNFSKQKEEKRLVYGIVYEPNKADWQYEFMSEETIENMAHNFMLHYRQIDTNHDFMKGTGGVVESFIARKGDPDFPKGSWILVTKVFDDKVWEQIKKGEITGYSLAGIGKYGDVKEVETDINELEEKLFSSNGLF